MKPKRRQTVAVQKFTRHKNTTSTTSVDKAEGKGTEPPDKSVKQETELVEGNMATVTAHRVQERNEKDGAVILQDEFAGEKYDKVRQMCDYLWKDGFESLVLTVNKESKKVWSCGSSTGSHFLEECQDLKEKFLTFCIDINERRGEEVKEVTMTEVTENDNDTSLGDQPDVETRGKKSESRNQKRSVKRTLESNVNAGPIRLLIKNENDCKDVKAAVKTVIKTSNKKTLKTKSKKELPVSDNTDMGTGKKKLPSISAYSTRTSKIEQSSSEVESMDDSETKVSIEENNEKEESVFDGVSDYVILTRVRNLKMGKNDNKDNLETKSDEWNTENNGLKNNKILEVSVKKAKKRKVKLEAIKVEVKQEKDSEKEDKTSLNQDDKDSPDVMLKTEGNYETKEDLFECIRDPNLVSISNGGIEVVWPVDKVYEKKDEDSIRPFSCKMCQKTFGTPSMVIRHVRSVHGTDTPYRCKMCKKLFKDKDAVLKHVRIHLVRTHACNICDKTYVDVTRLRKHMKTHEKAKVYQCNICKMEFEQRDSYSNHVISVHSNMRVKCDECDAQFRDGFTLRRHKIVKHTTGKNVKCDICLKAFKLRDNMLLHRRRFHEAKFSCEICGVKQPSKYTLKKHIEMVHEKKNELICDVCGRGFIYMHRFRIHRRTHTGEMPFKCSYCDKRYTNKESCMHHENTHTREKEYICDVCGQKYLQYGHLSRHKQLHDKTYKPIKCKYCDAGFRAYSAYRSHVFKEHREKELASGSGMIMTCEYCGKLFAHPTHLQSHIYRHTGEKPFECETCGKKFNDKSNLRQHKFTHDEKEIYHCKICQKTLTQRRSFRSHMKMHESKNEKVVEDSNVHANVSTADPLAAGIQMAGNQTAIALKMVVSDQGTGFGNRAEESYSVGTQTKYNEIVTVGGNVIENSGLGQNYEQSCIQAGLPGVDISGQAQNTEVEEIYILDLGSNTGEVKSEVHPELEKLQDTGEGNVMQLHKAPDVVSEYHVQVEESALNDGKNYVLVPQSDETTSTILVWENSQG